MSNETHTQTPWIIHPWDSDTILDAETFFCGRGSNHANATFIVTAVNAYAADQAKIKALTEACKEAIEAVERPHKGDMSGPCNYATRVLKEALSLGAKP